MHLILSNLLLTAIKISPKVWWIMIVYSRKCCFFPFFYLIFFLHINKWQIEAGGWQWSNDVCKAFLDVCRSRKKTQPKIGRAKMCKWLLFSLNNDRKQKFNIENTTILDLNLSYFCCLLHPNVLWCDAFLLLLLLFQSKQSLKKLLRFNRNDENESGTMWCDDLPLSNK